MILDTLDQLPAYEALSPRFAQACVFLRAMTDQTPVGRHEIDGEDVYAIVQQHRTKPVTERDYESHRKYIDVQYIHRGREVMYWAPLPLLTRVTTAFDAGKDSAHYALVPEGVPLHVVAGQFAIFFPEDGHVPSCAWGEAAEVVKAVVKIRA